MPAKAVLYSAGGLAKVKRTIMRIARALPMMMLPIIAAMSLRAQPPASAPASSQDVSRSFALLVGVSKYETLPPQRHLKGPYNDVELMRTLLREKFAFPDANI